MIPSQQWLSAFVACLKCYMLSVEVLLCLELSKICHKEYTRFGVSLCFHILSLPLTSCKPFSFKKNWYYGRDFVYFASIWFTCPNSWCPLCAECDPGNAKVWVWQRGCLNLWCCRVISTTTKTLGEPSSWKGAWVPGQEMWYLDRRCVCTSVIPDNHFSPNWYAWVSVPNNIVTECASTVS